MKRRALFILLLLVAGAIVNVAVAWGCSGLGRFPDGWPGFVDDADLDWLVRRGWKPMQGDWLSHTAEQRLSGRGFEYSLISETGMPNRIRFTGGPPRWTFAVRVHAGWPLASLSGERLDRRALSRLEVPRSSASSYVPIVFDNVHRSETWTLPTRLNTILGVDKSRILPARPIWPGFAINTVFYAFILWLVFAAPFALRRRRRIKRGLCPKCGYDLRGCKDAEKCPECGQLLGPSQLVHYREVG